MIGVRVCQQYRIEPWQSLKRYPGCAHPPQEFPKRRVKIGVG
jgi:hypothetical protein